MKDAKERSPVEPLSQLGEFGLIERLTSLLAQPSSRSNEQPGLVAIGDDCAVLPFALLSPSPGASLVATTDALVEGRHFSLELSTPFEVGWKSIAVSLSDIAAMGGAPRAALIALSLSPGVSIEFVEECYRGVQAICSQYEVTVVGGDIVKADQLSLAVTVLGVVEGAPALRSGAAPGDDLWVSGAVGDAAAGLMRASSARDVQKQRHSRPDPRVPLGRALGARQLVSSMIDVSDGLLQDVDHLARRSGAAIILEPHAVPCTAACEAGLSRAEALTGGDDYELLFTSSAAQRQTVAALGAEIGIPVSRIGTVEAGFGVHLLREDGSRETLEQYLKNAGLGSAGYTHF